MAQRPLYVGIDLGTTNSTASVFDGEQVTLIRNAQGATLTPSVVRIDARGAVTVGARARRFLETDPKNTRGEFIKMWKDQPHRALPFRFGYPDAEKHNHLMITRPKT